MSTLARFQDIEFNPLGTDPAVANRLWNSSGVVEVSGSAPGNSKYYGTNGSGTKGYFDLPFSGGDVVGPSSSIDSEIALFNSTTGKLIKRATGSGLAVLSSGILSTATNNSSNWDTAFTERHQWDGGATNLVAATGRTSLGLVIGTNVQAWDADLDTLASLTPTTNNFIVSVGSAWASRTPTQVKSTLAIANTDVSGLGTASTLASDTDGTLATNSDSRIATQKAVKTYIDGINTALLAAIAALDSKDEVAYCSTSALPTCTYSNGTLGVGATLTATTNGPLIIDGVTTVIGAQGLGVLVAGQASDFQNGWYTLTQQGVVAVSPWILTRRTPDDQAAEIGPGYLTAVEAPTGLTAGSNNQRVFLSISPVPFVVGTDSLTFAMVGGTYTAGNGLSLSGTAFSINTAITADLSTAQSLTNKKLGSLTSNGFVKTGSGDGTLSVDTTSYQPLDSDLTTLAGLTATTDNFIVSASSAWASRTPAQVRTTLGLVIGTNVQAWDADLDSWAAITRASGFDTFTATSSSANLRSLLTDELGTGAALFDGATLTALLTFAACGSSLASFNLPAGTVPTTPNDGDMFADANCFYGCTDAGNPGYIPITNFLRAHATVTQANDNSAHAIFTTPANGRITLETGTYRFRGVMAWTSMSATSGNLKVDILGAGTATTGNWLWVATGNDNSAAGSAANGSTSWHTASASGPSILAVQTGTACSIMFDGSVEITGAGTLIPTQTLVTAAAAVLSIGSFIEFWRVGTSSVTTAGQWD